MALPVISVPEFSATIPSTQQKIMFRPFLVQEQKILLLVRESDEDSDMIDAVKKILVDCILDDVDVSKLASFDIEYLFLNLRAKSVGETIDLKMKHTEGECQNLTDVSLNIEDVKVVSNNEHQNPIMLTESIGVKMRYPNFDTNISGTSKVQVTFDTIAACIEQVFDADEVYDDFSKEEMDKWIERMSEEQFGKINQFFTTMPALKHTVKYTCPKCHKQEVVELEGLASFFT